jgi:hypothetical protein
MGMRRADEVPPFFIVRNPSGIPNTQPGRDPQSNVTFGGTRRDVTIADVTAALGTRNPAPRTGRGFRQAFVYVPVGGQAEPIALERIERIRAAFPEFFGRSTEGRASVDTRLR